MAAKIVMRDVASFPFLSRVWKEQVRPGLRKHTFKDFFLAQDPVQFASYEWGLDSFIGRLVSDLRAATYSPEPADIFRGAKRSGLSRPLAFLAPRDVLLFCAMVESVEEELRAELRPWTGAHRGDKKIDDEPVDEWSIDDGYDTVFSTWLRRQGIVADICAHHEYVVESDISNFFGAINLDVLQEFLLDKTSMHRDVVRLAIHVIRRVLRHPEYAESPSLGLPQETFDASRKIAHAMLCEVDAAFDTEGEDGKYSRFVDDFVAGADTVAAGEEMIARLQRKLDRLGLYQNSSKTRVVPIPTFIRDQMTTENDYLDSVEKMLKPLEVGPLRELSGVPEDLVEDLLKRGASLRDVLPVDRPQRYDRVRRRYYTVFRRLGLDCWLPFVLEDLVSHPDGGKTLLEYVRSFPLSLDVVDRLYSAARVHRACYDDLALMYIETLATAPNGSEPDVWAAVAKGALALAAELSNEAGQPRSLADWMLAYLVPVIGKFGSAAEQGRFLSKYVDAKPPQCVVRLQAFPMHVSRGTPSAQVFQRDLAGLPWSSVLTIDFVRAVEAGDDRAIDIVLGLLQPEVRLLPNRYMIHPRPLLLCGLLARSGGKDFPAAVSRSIKTLSKNPARLADHRLVELLKDHAF
jgi:hypothetical protein